MNASNTDPRNRPALADHAARHLGIELVAADADHVVTRLEVQPSHLNALGVCHGGILFTLADVAMAYLSNHGGPAGAGPGTEGDWAAFAAHAEIDFLRPAAAGAVLTATARLAATAGRTGIHDIEILDQDDRLVAVFRGRTRRVERPPSEAPTVRTS